jgi:hypothetical protein
MRGAELVGEVQCVAKALLERDSSTAVHTNRQFTVNRDVRAHTNTRCTTADPDVDDVVSRNRPQHIRIGREIHLGQRRHDTTGNGHRRTELHRPDAQHPARPNVLDEPFTIGLENDVRSEPTRRRSARR